MEAVVANPGRRYLVMSGIGLFAGAMVPKILKPPTEKYIRPPAAVSPELFNSLCCRCGNCGKACPTGIIVSQTDLANIIWLDDTGNKFSVQVIAWKHVIFAAGFVQVVQLPFSM